MSNHRYMDYQLVDEVPNKYDLTPQNIKKLKIIDWDKLKKHTWHNAAMSSTGSWWCHLEGSGGGYFDDVDTFWIGFRESDNKVDCHFTSFEGMCGYKFKKFYDIQEIENKYDMIVQVKAIQYLNMLIDENILQKEQ